VGRHLAVPRCRHQGICKVHRCPFNVLAYLQGDRCERPADG
jgi:hypothetical protein